LVSVGYEGGKPAIGERGRELYIHLLFSYSNLTLHFTKIINHAAKSPFGRGGGMSGRDHFNGSSNTDFVSSSGDWETVRRGKGALEGEMERNHSGDFSRLDSKDSFDLEQVNLVLFLTALILISLLFL
jgi:hypothetical protein